MHKDVTLILSSGYIDTAAYNEAERQYDFAIVGCQHAEIDPIALLANCSQSFKGATRSIYFNISIGEDVVKEALMTDTIDDIDPNDFLGRRIVFNSKGIGEFLELVKTPDSMFVDFISFPPPEAQN